MKRRSLLTILAVALAVSMSTIFSQPSLKAQSSDDDNQSEHQKLYRQKLSGAWEVTVTRPDGTTFLSLMTFTESGEALEESNNTPIRSLAHGEWVRTGERRFTRTWVYFRFVPTSNPATPRLFVGTNRNTANMVLSEDLGTFNAVACSQLYDVNGDPEGTRRCLNETGHRLEMDTIDEQPIEP
jgi:hypothetical protein